MINTSSSKTLMWVQALDTAVTKTFATMGSDGEPFAFWDVVNR